MDHMNTRRFVLCVAGALTLTLAVGAPAWAHHSTASYDAANPISLEGTVKEFLWKNPHIFMTLVVNGPKGPAEWVVECGTPNINARNGWKRDSINAGDKVKVVMNPSRSGSFDGQAATVTLPDGTVLRAPGSEGSVEALPPAPAK